MDSLEYWCDWGKFGFWNCVALQLYQMFHCRWMNYNFKPTEPKWECNNSVVMLVKHAYISNLVQPGKNTRYLNRPN